MSVEVNEFSFVMIAVPVLATAFGLYLAVVRSGNAWWRWGGICLSVLGPAQIVATLLWFERGCFETWQPCGGAYGATVWLLWLGLALVLALASASYLVGAITRRGKSNG